MMHFLNATEVLTNRVNCSGSTFNLTLRALLSYPQPLKLMNRGCDCVTLLKHGSNHIEYITAL